MARAKDGDSPPTLARIVQCVKQIVRNGTDRGALSKTDKNGQHCRKVNKQRKPLRRKSEVETDNVIDLDGVVRCPAHGLDSATQATVPCARPRLVHVRTSSIVGQ